MFPENLLFVFPKLKFTLVFSGHGLKSKSRLVERDRAQTTELLRKEGQHQRKAALGCPITVK